MALPSNSSWIQCGLPSNSTETRQRSGFSCSWPESRQSITSSMPNEKNVCSTRPSQSLSPAESKDNRLDPIKQLLGSSANFPEALGTLVIATGAFRITTSPFRSSRSPISKCAEEARSSARFDRVTRTRRSYRSRFPRSSLTVRTPETPIAMPTVPRRSGVTRLSIITTPIVAF